MADTLLFQHFLQMFKGQVSSHDNWLYFHGRYRGRWRFAIHLRTGSIIRNTYGRHNTLGHINEAVFSFAQVPLFWGLFHKKYRLTMSIHRKSLQLPMTFRLLTCQSKEQMMLVDTILRSIRMQVNR
ncbi:MAG: hypothetical protein AAF587_17725 [Bacteroidota bacterium]